MFQLLGTWHNLEDVQAVRVNLEIVPMMNAMVALTDQAQPREFKVFGVVAELALAVLHEGDVVHRAIVGPRQTLAPAEGGAAVGRCGRAIP